MKSDCLSSHLQKIRLNERSFGDNMILGNSDLPPPLVSRSSPGGRKCSPVHARQICHHSTHQRGGRTLTDDR
ncbi:hypothetical protein E2C01_081927 [Portunus trituberculatus]|uniref:Uncharacterized protein n=1 Tax=Portunus trituberculatus TaxID=210409 RepID=A0A5B7J072_PORTR|nr:hypothetical protein [Portunus trituberculatus]